MPIPPPQTIAKHGEAILCLHELIMDLKLMLQGRQTIETITLARIEELERHVEKLSECRDRTIYY
jgi:hypothetical protein